MNTYEFTHTAKCPNGELNDAYEISVESSKTIMVEDILKAREEAPNPAYQESLADWFRNRLAARVRVVGWHHGIKIICQRE